MAACTLASSGLAAARLVGQRPAGLRASALPLRRRGALRVAAIAAPAEEVLGKAKQQPEFEVRRTGWARAEGRPEALAALQAPRPAVCSPASSNALVHGGPPPRRRRALLTRPV